MKKSAEVILKWGKGWLTVLENKIGGKWNTSDGIVENVIQECTFKIYYDKYKFIVEAYLLDEDNHDTYSIRVYDNTNSEIRDDETQIDHVYLDSTGGGCNGEDLCICPLGEDRPHLEEVDEIIMETLFGKEGLIIEF